MSATKSRCYFGCDFAFAFFVAVAFVLFAGALFAFAFVLVTGAVMGTLVGCGVAGAAGAGVGVASAGADCRTEREPVSAGSESIKATSMKMAAAAMVIRASTVCVPRGPKAVLDTELVKSAPASDLPGCSKTVTTSTIHASMNSPYNK